MRLCLIILLGALLILPGCVGWDPLEPTHDMRSTYIGPERPKVIFTTTPFGRDADWETGYVVVAILLSPDGRVAKTKILDSNVSRKMAVHALESVATWEFERPRRYRPEGCAIF